MTTSPKSGLSKTLGSIRSVRSLPALLERIDQVEQALEQTRIQVEELRDSVQSIDSVRDEVRELTVHLTEQLNHIAATLSVPTR